MLLVVPALRKETKKQERNQEARTTKQFGIFYCLIARLIASTKNKKPSNGVVKFYGFGCRISPKNIARIAIPRSGKQQKGGTKVQYADDLIDEAIDALCKGNYSRYNACIEELKLMHVGSLKSFYQSLSRTLSDFVQQYYHLAACSRKRMRKHYRRMADKVAWQAERSKELAHQTFYRPVLTLH